MKYFYQTLGIITFITLFASHAYSFSGKRKNFFTKTEEPSVMLSETMEWSDEHLLQKLVLSAENVEKLKLKADEYSKYESGKLSKTDAQKFESQCESDSSNPFCYFLYEDVEEKTGQRRVGKKKVKAPSRTLLVKLFKQKKWDELQENLVESRDYQSLFRYNLDFKSVNDASKNLMESGKCMSTRFLTSLAQKNEEFFPSADAFSNASHLFKQSIACGDDAFSIRSMYRLGLLGMMQGKCDEVMRYYPKLEAKNDYEFSSRSLFWLYRCNQKEGLTSKALDYAKKLREKHPMSYHSMIVRNETSIPFWEFTPSEDSQVKLQTETSESLSAKVVAVSALLAIKERNRARRELQSMSQEIQDAEAGFQLFYAVLLGRADLYLDKFKTVARIMDRTPENISKKTLKLYFPLPEEENISLYHDNIDPFFISALMRQESAFQRNARSIAGAIGLMQIMPRTARSHERVSNQGLYDPKTNVRIGVKHLKRLLSRYEWDAELVLASYNAGEDRVDDWKKRYVTEDRLVFLDLIPYRETRDYVARISRNYWIYSELYREGRFPSSHFPENKKVKNVNDLKFSFLAKMKVQ